MTVAETIKTVLAGAAGVYIGMTIRERFGRSRLLLVIVFVSVFVALLMRGAR